MSHTHQRTWLSRINPLRAYKRRHRGEPGPIWLMTSTAPFQVPITIYLFLTGLVYLLVGTGLTPNSITETYDWRIVLAWSACLFVGGGLSMFGRYTQKFRMESAGLGFVLASCVIYAATVIVVNGWIGLFASGGFFAIGAGCIIRMIVIAKSHQAERLVGQILQDRLNGDAQ
jgi:hypothetical protein